MGPPEKLRWAPNAPGSRRRLISNIGPAPCQSENRRCIGCIISSGRSSKTRHVASTSLHLALRHGRSKEPFVIRIKRGSRAERSPASSTGLNPRFQRRDRQQPSSRRDHWPACVGRGGSVPSGYLAGAPRNKWLPGLRNERQVCRVEELLTAPRGRR